MQIKEVTLDSKPDGLRIHVSEGIKFADEIVKFCNRSEQESIQVEFTDERTFGIKAITIAPGEFIPLTFKKHIHTDMKVHPEGSAKSPGGGEDRPDPVTETIPPE